jgi:hypothetical protein
MLLLIAPVAEATPVKEVEGPLANAEDAATSAKARRVFFMCKTLSNMSMKGNHDQSIRFQHET